MCRYAPRGLSGASTRTPISRPFAFTVRSCARGDFGAGGGPARRPWPAGISYIFGGEKELDLKGVLEKLRKRFGIRRLLLEGGGGINGSMLRAGLIDELSILVVPVADGSTGTPTLFDVGASPASAAKLTLMSAKKLKGSVVWLRYRVR